MIWYIICYPRSGLPPRISIEMEGALHWFSFNKKNSYGENPNYTQTNYRFWPFGIELRIEYGSYWFQQIFYKSMLSTWKIWGVSSISIDNLLFWILLFFCNWLFLKNGIFYINISKTKNWMLWFDVKLMLEKGTKIYIQPTIFDQSSNIFPPN